MSRLILSKTPTEITPIIRLPIIPPIKSQSASTSSPPITYSYKTQSGIPIAESPVFNYLVTTLENDFISFYESVCRTLCFKDSLTHDQIQRNFKVILNEYSIMFQLMIIFLPAFEYDEFWTNHQFIKQKITEFESHLRDMRDILFDDTSDGQTFDPYSNKYSRGVWRERIYRLHGVGVIPGTTGIHGVFNDRLTIKKSMTLGHTEESIRALSALIKYHWVTDEQDVSWRIIRLEIDHFIRYGFPLVCLEKLNSESLIQWLTITMKTNQYTADIVDYVSLIYELIYNDYEKFFEMFCLDYKHRALLYKAIQSIYKIEKTKDYLFYSKEIKYEQ